MKIDKRVRKAMFRDLTRVILDEATMMFSNGQRATQAQAQEYKRNKYAFEACNQIFFTDASIATELLSLVAHKTGDISISVKDTDKFNACMHQSKKGVTLCLVKRTDTSQPVLTEIFPVYKIKQAAMDYADMTCPEL